MPGVDQNCIAIIDSTIEGSIIMAQASQLDGQSKPSRFFSSQKCNNANSSLLFVWFVWCLPARQHWIGQFVPTAGG